MHMTTPYDSADPKLLEEIISQAEKRLQAQLELGKGADQRAMTFAGVLLAGVALLVGLVFGDHPITSHQPELVCVAFGFIVSAAMALWSARPMDWEIIGNTPASYDEDIANGRKFAATRPETAMHLDDMISKNHETLRCNGNWMLASMAIALVSATGGLIGAVIRA
jgi:hypothetical protein